MAIHCRQSEHLFQPQSAVVDHGKKFPLVFSGIAVETLTLQFIVYGFAPYRPRVCRNTSYRRPCSGCRCSFRPPVVVVDIVAAVSFLVAAVSVFRFSHRCSAGTVWPWWTSCLRTRSWRSGCTPWSFCLRCLSTKRYSANMKQFLRT